jgi:uncharacterized protein YjiK
MTGQYRDPYRASLLAALIAWVGCGVGIEAGADAPADAPVASLAAYPLSDAPSGHPKLPGRLREISGLTTTQDGRLLAHNDERGIIYEVGAEDGRIVKEFRLGKRGVEADFEGIAMAGDTLFLVASDGTLFETREGVDEERVEFKKHKSGVGEECEVEGLDFDPTDRMLLLACKTTRGEAAETATTIFRWSVDRQSLQPEGTIRIAKREILRVLPSKGFHPSGIVRHPLSGNYFVLSAREHAILEIAPSGAVLGGALLPRGRHPHAEGIAIGGSGVGDMALVIGDEGDDHKARLARYPLRSLD